VSEHEQLGYTLGIVAW